MHPLLEGLARFGDRDAIVFAGKAYSYRDLVRALADWQETLDHHGVGPGEVVAVEVECSPDACGLLLALIDRGTIVVPMTAQPPARRRELLDLAQVQVRVSAAGNGPGHCQRTGRRARHELYRRLREARAPGLVLFSSGTTGEPKASVLNFAKMLDRYRDQTRPRRMLSFLNLDHIGGLNTLLYSLSLGGAVIAVRDRTPDTVFAAVAEHRAQVLPTTPTFLKMVLISGAHERYPTETLELITYGTEPMPLDTLRRLRSALPHVRLKQTYGLSELGILPTSSRSDDSLWVKLGGRGFEHKVVDGTLWIRSDMAMLGYLNAPDPFDSDRFFNTQDAVEIDGDYVRILGRSSEVINVAGAKVHPSEVESVLLELSNIAEATVGGRPSTVTGTVVEATVRLVEAEDAAAVSRRVREHCRARLEAFKVPTVVRVSDRPQHSDRFKKVRNLR
jgi:acyl-coenzyme A synthetase/AMP-(fatty) acid ligase